MGAELQKSLILGAFALLLGSTSAFADCVRVGQIVTCSGLDADGFGGNSNDFDNLEITVETGAEVTGGATARALRLDDGGSITVQTGAVVRSDANEGIEADNDTTVVNFGVIEGFDDALQVNDGAMIDNYGRIENIGTNLDDPQDAIDIDSGIINNYAGGIIRSTLDAAIDVDGNERGGVTVNNAGLISGAIGVLQDPANLSAQIINNEGTLTGTSGVAFDLGFGQDRYVHKAGAALNGSGIFGSDDDVMEIHALDIAGPFGGRGALMDGGEGFDLFDLSAFSVSSLTFASYGSTVLTMGLNGGAGEVMFNLTNWESILFSDFSGSQSDVAARFTDPAPVPLPAGGMLLAFALAGLAGLRRRAA